MSIQLLFPKELYGNAYITNCFHEREKALCDSCLAEKVAMARFEGVSLLIIRTEFI